jgi:hypothetical protein
MPQIDGFSRKRSAPILLREDRGDRPTTIQKCISVESYRPSNP